jgi:hypothetical protein
MNKYKLSWQVKGYDPLGDMTFREKALVDHFPPYSYDGPGEYGFSVKAGEFLENHGVIFKDTVSLVVSRLYDGESIDSSYLYDCKVQIIEDGGYLHDGTNKDGHELVHCNYTYQDCLRIENKVFWNELDKKIRDKALYDIEKVPKRYFKSVVADYRNILAHRKISKG